MKQILIISLLLLLYNGLYACNCGFCSSSNNSLLNYDYNNHYIGLFWLNNTFNKQLNYEFESEEKFNQNSLWLSSNVKVGKKLIANISIPYHFYNLNNKQEHHLGDITTALKFNAIEKSSKLTHQLWLETAVTFPTSRWQNYEDHHSIISSTRAYGFNNGVSYVLSVSKWALVNNLSYSTFLTNDEDVKYGNTLQANVLYQYSITKDKWMFMPAIGLQYTNAAQGKFFDIIDEDSNYTTFNSTFAIDVFFNEKLSVGFSWQQPVSKTVTNNYQIGKQVQVRTLFYF